MIDYKNSNNLNFLLAVEALNNKDYKRLIDMGLVAGLVKCKIISPSIIRDRLTELCESDGKTDISSNPIIEIPQYTKLGKQVIAARDRYRKKTIFETPSSLEKILSKLVIGVYRERPNPSYNSRV